MTSNNTDDFVANLVAYRGDDSRRRRDRYLEAETEIKFRLSFGFRALQASIVAHLQQALPYDIDHDIAVKIRPTSSTSQEAYVALDDNNFVMQITRWFKRQQKEPKNVGVPLFVYIGVMSKTSLQAIQQIDSEQSVLGQQSGAEARVNLQPQSEAYLGKRTREEPPKDDDRPSCCQRTEEWRRIPIRFQNSDEFPLEVHIPTLKRLLNLS